MIVLSSYKEEINGIHAEHNDYAFRIYSVPIGARPDQIEGWNYVIIDTRHDNKVVFKDTYSYKDPRVAFISALSVFLSEEFDIEE
jgi:DNA-binding beta-propeller fold protein YncE